MTRLDGKICTDADLALAEESSATVYCLTRGQSIGLTLTAEAGIISAIAVLYVLCRIIINVKRYWRYPNERLIKEPMDLYMLSLFISDLIQAMGAALDIKWINEGEVRIGSYCTAQGVVQQLGETVVAMSTGVIALQTFLVVWWGRTRYTQSLRIAAAVTLTVWLFVIIFVGASAGTKRNRDNLYITPTPYWCWVSQNYTPYRNGGEYAWLWITLCFSALLYTFLFFWSRGNIVQNETNKWRFSVRWNHATVETEQRRISYRMIAYPIVYSILIVPLSAVRYIGFHDEATRHTLVASAATLAVITVYGLSGAFNVILFFVIRSNLLLFRREEEGRKGDTPMTVLPDHIPPGENAKLRRHVSIE